MNGQAERSGTPTSRMVVWESLTEAENNRTWPVRELEQRQSGLSSRDQAFARSVLSTVVVRQLTLKAILSHFVNRPIERGLEILLHMGAAQLVFSKEDDAHAAVNETVQTARLLGSDRWCKFLNGVLRNLSREPMKQVPFELKSRCCPSQDGSFGIEFEREFFADPQHEPTRYLSQAFSVPPWMINRWRTWQSDESLIQTLGASLRPGPVTLRCNLLSCPRDQLIERLQDRGVEVFPGTTGAGLLVGSHSGSLVDLPEWIQGDFSIQDETAQQAGIALNPQPGDSVLDLCAAPGTKTTHLAELMQNRGSVIACDVSEDRLSRVQENANRLGLNIITTRKISAKGEDIPPGPFDAILIDAPCSNTGVLGKRIEVRYRITQRDIRELAEIQARLLAQAADRLSDNGRILYSTCSLEPEENALQTKRFLSDSKDFQLISERLFLPGNPSDGGYQALFKRERR